MKKFAYGLLAQGKNVSYVTLVLAPLSAMFHHAIEDGHLAVSPTPRILRHAHTDPHRKNDFFTDEETAASFLIQQDESLAYVKEQMGHHSITITVDTYGTLCQEETKPP